MKSVNYSNTIWHLQDNGEVFEKSGKEFNIFEKPVNIELPEGLLSKLVEVYEAGTTCHKCSHVNHFSSDECEKCNAFI